jgi:carboxypeptidase family protein
MSKPHAITTPISLGRSFAAIALLLAFLSLGALARAGTSGGIAGIVTDAKTGAPIPGVQLKLASPSQSVETTTDGHGHYIVFSLQPDDYTITADKAGYSSSSVSGYTVNADQTQRYDLQLTPATNAPDATATPSH